MTKSQFRRLVSRFSRVRCVVVGDVMLDEWIWGSVSRISPEAPVPVVDVTRRTVSAGGGSNVAANLRALGARVSVLGVVGRDEPGRLLRRELVRHKVETHGLLVVEDRPTTQKTRIIAHGQQVVRADFERRSPLNGSFLKRFLAHLGKDLAAADLVVISDYGKGVVTEGLLRATARDAERRGVPVVVGPKPSAVPWCRGVTALTLNQRESAEAVGRSPDERSADGRRSVERAGCELLELTESEAVLITRGEAGMSLFRRGATPRHLAAHASQVYDVSGAGDTVLAVFALARVSGGSWPAAMELANLAASVVVRKVGTATAPPEEIEALL